MISRILLSRRDLLVSAVGIAAAQPPTITYFLEAKANVCGSVMVRLLRDACAELRCPTAISSICKRALPLDDSGLERLQACILDDLISAGRDCTTLTAMRHSLRVQSREDFMAGRIIHVDGWLLSLTEARVYALGGYSTLRS